MLENFDTLKELIPAAGVLASVVLGVVQVIKTAFLNEKTQKYCGVISIVFGVLATCLMTEFSVVYIVGGIIVGLTASGAWSTVKSAGK